ncbi:uncharacterized protein LOC105664963 [Ceratitis capitata]|uniref:uncharacterized protein LOC105664963 n=1 Tax=Ceratitis capitata TaxID=7213 RepID=UPI0006189436|nr:uncharacterized protein LOC105664963 [Ceratitis capitata]
MAAEESIDYQLTENFIFFQDILKQPEDVFDCRSREYKLARAWLDKLSMSGFETIEDLRLRNVYMSHLVACLNYGKLTGPFVSMPKPGPTLDPSDFQSTEKPRLTCPRPPPSAPASHKACLTTQSTSTPCECAFVCCDKQEDKRDCDSGKSPFDRICGYMTQYMNVPACMDGSLSGKFFTKDADTSCAITSAGTSSALYQESDKYEADACCSAHQDNVLGDPQLVYERITVLLDAIASELRGDQTPGNNDYLEYELARYKKFIMGYSKVAAEISKLQARKSLRSYLLLNLQNDLVKLLNEGSPPEVNAKRVFTYDR